MAPGSNLFAHYGYAQADIDGKIDRVWKTIFEGPEEERFYFEAQDETGFLMDTGNFDVRTEGMSYGMMMALLMDRKDIFDRLWKWSRLNMSMTDGPQAGYFAWSCAPDGRKNAQGAAPDGEEYFIMDLILASRKWGNGTGIFDYAAEARTLMKRCLHGPLPMWNKENTYIRFVPDCEFTDPSYHLPHFYEQFAEFSADSDSAFWKQAAKESRKFFTVCCHPATGFAPEYSYYDGTPNPWGPPEGHGYFYSDAYRVAATIGLDALWCGKTPELSRIAANMQAFFVDIPVEDYMTYEIDGTVVPQKALHPVGLLATLAQSSLAVWDDPDPAVSANAEKIVRRFWDTPLRTGERRYYDNCLYFFALLALGGKCTAYQAGR